MPLVLPRGSRLVVATHNPGKVPEIAALLEGRFDLVSAAELGLPEPAETEQTFAGNALLKARHAAKASGLIAIADDSGLSVAALDGSPGIYSARWAGPSKDFTAAMEGPSVVVEGEVHGELVFPARGARGFGYDPIFVPTGGAQTFGEMEPTAKDAISHRAVAFAKLRAALIE